jgi:taurine dioxygenase
MGAHEKGRILMTTTYEHIDVNPVTGVFGAEISGIDLSEPLDDALFEEVNRALLDYHVIFFRDQDITPRQHVEFGRRFGDLHIHPFIPAHEEQPEIIVLGGKTPGPGPYARNANVWHTDLTYSQEPPMGSILHGVEVPGSGGDTMFADLTAAYEGLSDRLQHLFSDMIAVHSMSATKTRQELTSPRQVKEMQWSLERVPPAEHPVVRTHPETGQKCLFVSRHFTSHLKDVSDRESEALLNLLHTHIDHPEYQCRFRWKKNSIAFWDNRCTQHYAVADYTQIRRMHRVTICGPRPV